jgi:hypothetical protein
MSFKPLNRTILELKCEGLFFFSFLYYSLNRTILELKFKEGRMINSIGSVPQSHHTGIEIRIKKFVPLLINIPQSHHTGIEII